MKKIQLGIRIRWGMGFIVAMTLVIVVSQIQSQDDVGVQHAISSHQQLMDFAADRASGLLTPLTFTSAERTRMRDGTRDEDNLLRPLNHGYNPLTGGAFPLGTTAHAQSQTRWNSMRDAFASGNLDGGDGVGAWHFLGRVSHLLQDMSSPLHVFAIEHATSACQFEEWWDGQGGLLNTLFTGTSGPLHSNVLDVKALENLDVFSQQRLWYRFNNSCPNKNADDVRGWMEVMAWVTYFRATIWGEVSFGVDGDSGTATSATTTPTTFSDGTVAAQPNALHTMFDGNVRWRVTWNDSFYEITDRVGSVFRWMKWNETDDWGPCGNRWASGQQDASKRTAGGADDARGARITGRFWFDSREIGKDSAHPLCYPHRHPNGEAMTDQLYVYWGKNLFPLTARYNAGLLGLANRRVRVNTNESVANGFSWSRKDNHGNGPGFAADADGGDFYFVAKSQVTLTAPSQNSQGRPFQRWLQNGQPLAGDTNRSITINTVSAPIPPEGVIYTAEYEPCLFEITPTSRLHNSPSATGSVSVVGAAGCAWAATSHADWITIQSGNSGTGNGTVIYAIGVNTFTLSRIGTLSIAGQTFTVTQNGIPSPKPNLMIASFSVSPNNGTQGDGATITVTVVNAGDAPADGIDLQVCIYRNAPPLDCREVVILTDSASPTALIYPPPSICELTRLESLRPGSTQTVVVDSFRFPYICGTLTAWTFVDCDNRIDESNETNNTASLSYRVVCQPDLVVQAIATDKPAYILGEFGTATVTVHNQGASGTGVGYWVDLHRNAPLPVECNNMTRHRRVLRPALAAGGTDIFQVPFAASELGSLTLRLFADATCAIAESSETNNQATMNYFVTARPPDLALESLTLNKIAYAPGEAGTATITIRNRGSGSTNAAFTVDIYRQLSNGATVGCNASYYRRVIRPPLAAGAADTFSVPFTVFSVNGNFLLRAYADSTCAIAETNENNNQQTASFIVGQLGPPDLIVESITLNKSTYAPSESGTATIIIRNQGSGSTNAAFTVDIYRQLSTGATVSCNANYYRRTNRPVLAAGATDTFTLPFTVFAVEGTYKIRIFADSTCAIEESDESNNQNTVVFNILAPAPTSLKNDGTPNSP